MNWKARFTPPPASNRNCVLNAGLLTSIVLVLSACGSGSGAEEAADESARNQVQRNAVRLSATETGSVATAVPAPDLDPLFNWAESTYPQFFPGHRANQSADPYVYRYYPETGNYVGVSGTGIWLLGPVAGDLSKPQYLAEISRYTCSVVPSGCKEPVTLRWTTRPTDSVVPGLLADPDPTSPQDFGLNSSAVARLERNGIPVAGERVVWTISDPTGQVQTFSSVSDQRGDVRAWYLAGAQPQQTLSVQHVWSGSAATLQMQRSNALSATVGRYVATYFSAPTGSYDAVAVTVIPRTTPERTYYQLATVWTTDGQLAFYGGLQKSVCPYSGPIAAAVESCSPARGKYMGSQALFSTWDWRTTTGAIGAAILVSKPARTSCQSHSELGSGLQCFTPLDWSSDETWTWTVATVAGAPAGYTRVRVSAANADRGIQQEVAVIDLAPMLNLSHLSAFNENWGGAPAATCLDVALRKMTIASVGFHDGSKWVAPAYGQAMGDLYPEALACKNYSLTASASGLDVSSGGTGIWVNMADALTKDAGSGQMQFSNQAQTIWQWQAIDISTLLPMR